MDLFLGRCAKHLDDLHELVNTRLTWEEGLSNEEFSDDAANGPDINSRGVVSRSKDELGCSVVPGADVGNIDFSSDKALSGSIVANLECVTLWIHEQVLGLDVPVAVTKRVDVGECTEGLVRVQFDQEDGDGLLHLVVVLEHAVDSLWDVVHHDIQIDFILLRIDKRESEWGDFSNLPCRPGCRKRAAVR